MTQSVHSFKHVLNAGCQGIKKDISLVPEEKHGNRVGTEEGLS